jgi:hypothetical protein
MIFGLGARSKIWPLSRTRTSLVYVLVVCYEMNTSYLAKVYVFYYDTVVLYLVTSVMKGPAAHSFIFYPSMQVVGSFEMYEYQM